MTYYPNRTPTEQIDRQGFYQARNAERKLDVQRRRDGIRMHIVDPTDPWSDTEWRACEPGCPQHGGWAA